MTRVNGLSYFRLRNCVQVFIYHDAKRKTSWKGLFFGFSRCSISLPGEWLISMHVLSSGTRVFMDPAFLGAQSLALGNHKRARMGAKKRLSLPSAWSLADAAKNRKNSRSKGIFE